VRSTEASVRATVEAATMELAPGATAEVKMTIDWEAGPRTWKPWDRATAAGTVELSGRVRSKYEDVFQRQIGWKLKPTLSGESGDLAGTAHRGRPWFWGAGVGLFLLAAAAATALRWLRHHQSLYGTLQVHRNAKLLGDLPLTGRRGRIPLSAVGLTGTCRVRLRDGELAVTHTSEAETVQRWCRPDGPPVIIHGVTFGWRVHADGPLPDGLGPPFGYGS